MITSAKLLFFRELSSPQTENLPIFNVLKGITWFQRGENKGREPSPTSSALVLRLVKRQVDYPLLVSPHYYMYRPSVVAVFFAPLAYAASPFGGDAQISRTQQGMFCAAQNSLLCRRLGLTSEVGLPVQTSRWDGSVGTIDHTLLLIF